MKIIVIVACVFIFIFITELLFRCIYRNKYKHVPKLSWNDNYIVDHPFLSFSYAKNKIVKPKKLLNYDLQQNDYYSYEKDLTLNNMGHFGKDFSTEKDPSTLRVVCLGNSTTANNIAFNGVDYSYPTLLETYLTNKTKQKIEVYNCGIGGWTSVDILIDFLLNIVNTKPDYVIFCHGFVDLHLYLMDSFSLDYSHGRCNIGRKIHKLKQKSYLPQISVWHLYEHFRNKFFGNGNIRDELIEAIRLNKIHVDNLYNDLTVEKNIIKHLFVICKYHGIKLVVGTYPFYNYNKTTLSNKIEYGVNLENENIKELAKEFNVMFVDQNKNILKTKEYFLDWMHLTPKGMQFIAEEYGKEILKDYDEKC